MKLCKKTFRKKERNYKQNGSHVNCLQNWKFDFLRRTKPKLPLSFGTQDWLVISGSKASKSGQLIPRKNLKFPRSSKPFRAPKKPQNSIESGSVWAGKIHRSTPKRRPKTSSLWFDEKVVKISVSKVAFDWTKKWWKCPFQQWPLIWRKSDENASSASSTGSLSFEVNVLEKRESLTGWCDLNHEFLDFAHVVRWAKSSQCENFRVFREIKVGVNRSVKKWKIYSHGKKIVKSSI